MTVNVPRLINWSITNECNLNCGFCYRLRDKDSEFRDKQIIFQKMLDSGVNQITFTGGEPLLEDNLSYFAEQCKKHSIQTSLHTNATLSKQFYGVCDLFDRLSFSLDADSVEINSLLRGSSKYFYSVIEKIEYLKTQNRDFVIKTIITRQNYESIIDLVHLIKIIKPTFWSIFEFRPIRQGKTYNDIYILKHGEFDLLIEKIKLVINNEVALNIRSNNQAESHPIFLVSSNGAVYTSDVKFGDIMVGSLLNSSVADLWNIIKSKNKLSKEYINRDYMIKK